MNSPNANVAVKPGYAAQVRQRVAGLSTTYKIVFSVFLIIIVGILIYWGVTSRTSATLSARMNPVLIDGTPINAFNSSASQHPITLPVSNQGMEFTYSFWAYISDWSYRYGQKKYILVKGNLNNEGPSRWAPAIWLGEKVNTLHTSMALFPPQTNAFGNEQAQPQQYEECMVRDIPLQKWVHIAYVMNNRNIDVYIDAKLEKSCMLSGVPDINNRPLHILPKMPERPGEPVQDNGFYGQIANLIYFTSALEPNKIADIYMRGPYA